MDKECARLAKESVLWKTTVLARRHADLPTANDVKELERLNQKVAKKYIDLRYSRDTLAGMVLPKFLHELFTGHKITVKELEKLGFTLDANDFDPARMNLQMLRL